MELSGYYVNKDGKLCCDHPTNSSEVWFINGVGIGISEISIFIFEI